MTEIPRNIKPLQGDELLNFWCAVLNNVDPDEAKEAFNWQLSFASEGGYTLEDLIGLSEKADPMIRSMCYDALKKGGKEITEEQQKFLSENRWQNEFWN